MSLAKFMNTCPSCGAEESLDGLLMRMIDDDQVRRLIADVLTVSLALGSLALRYLRLHKPAKQKMRLDKVAAILGELVPDMKRLAITRKGRDWSVPLETWKAGFTAVFEAFDAGTLSPPLIGNSYLYEVLMRMVDKYEGEIERELETLRRRAGKRDFAEMGAVSVTDALAKAGAGQTIVPQTVRAPGPPVLLITEPPAPSRYALKLRAEIAAEAAAKAAPKPTTDDHETHD
ncbi:MAG: hypothetical protein K2W93_08920 [Burkholderiaceae bacterium]|nr:hypothetical protein [Burkholderiaceae bacterium]